MARSFFFWYDSACTPSSAPRASRRASISASVIVPLHRVALTEHTVVDTEKHQDFFFTAPLHA
jgi:hypothetical protein